MGTWTLPGLVWALRITVPCLFLMVFPQPHSFSYRDVLISIQPQVWGELSEDVWSSLSLSFSLTQSPCDVFLFWYLALLILIRLAFRKFEFFLLNFMRSQGEFCLPLSMQQGKAIIEFGLECFLEDHPGTWLGSESRRDGLNMEPCRQVSFACKGLSL